MTNFPITTDPVLLQNLQWAAAEGRKVEGIKTIRALIRNEIKDQAPEEPRVSLSLCAEIWNAFNPEAKMGIRAEDRLTFESKSQEEDPEYLLIVSRNDDTHVGHFCSYADAMYAAEEELANHLKSNVTIARSLAVSVTKRYMYQTQEEV